MFSFGDDASLPGVQFGARITSEIPATATRLLEPQSGRTAPPAPPVPQNIQLARIQRLPALRGTHTAAGKEEGAIAEPRFRFSISRRIGYAAFAIARFLPNAALRLPRRFGRCGVKWAFDSANFRLRTPDTARTPATDASPLLPPNSSKKNQLRTSPVRVRVQGTNEQVHFRSDPMLPLFFCCFLPGHLNWAPSLGY